MAVRLTGVLVLTFIAVALALDSVDNTGLKVIVKVFEECIHSEGFSPCLKKKAITYLDRLSRMDKLSISEEITITKDPNDASPQTSLTEEQLEQSLPRSLEERDTALTNMLWDKTISFLSSRSIELVSPKLSGWDIEEGRKKGGIGGGGGGGGGKKGGMMGMLLMGIMGKIVGLIPLGIAGLFLLAGKALITSKIALLIAGVIAIKKLLIAKQGGGGGGGGGGFGGYGGGQNAHQVWAGSGGGWDKRSFDESQKLAYNAHTPKQ